MKKLFFVLAMVLLLTSFTMADETKKAKEKDKDVLRYNIIVTATRTNQYYGELSSSTTVITAEDLKKSGKEMVVEALAEVPGLDVVQNGGVGKNASVFIRGANSEHTMVMIDGVEINDPMSPGRSFDFAHLTIDNIDRIEVIRGPQSTLYGSDAMGGVINIITIKGTGKPKFSIGAEGGSYNTYRESAGVRGGTKSVNYSLGISRFDSKGYSTAGEKYGNTEKDGYGNSSISARLGFNVFENFNIDFIARYTDAKNDLDNKSGEGGDDPNYTSHSKQFVFNTQADLSLLNGKWEQKIGFSFSNNDRDYQNDKDSLHPSDSLQSFYKGRILKIGWQNNLFLHKSNTLILGVEYENEKGESEYAWDSAWGPGNNIFPEKSANTIGFYIQDNITVWEKLFVTLGLRSDHHNLFGSEVTYRIAPAYIFNTNTKIKATYGTGFKAPSLYQLYAPATAWGPIGNENLGPEKSKGWDIGVEQYLFENRLMFGVTYFQNEFENLIEFDWQKGYVNISGAETSGIEIYISSRFNKRLTLSSSYTYTKTKDKETEEQLLRRPKNKFSLNLNYCFGKKTNVNVNIIYVGKRDDIYPYPTRVEVDAYTLVNLRASYNITSSIQLFFKVDNLFDEDYEVVKGYGTAGLSAYAGLKLNL